MNTALPVLFGVILFVLSHFEGRLDLSLRYSEPEVTEAEITPTARHEECRFLADSIPLRDFSKYDPELQPQESTSEVTLEVEDQASGQAAPEKTSTTLERPESSKSELGESET